MKKIPNKINKIINEFVEGVNKTMERYSQLMRVNRPTNVIIPKPTKLK